MASAVLWIFFSVSVALIQADFVEPGGCHVCPDTWIRFRNSCYRFVDSPTYDWVEAAHYCQTHKAHLATIESSEENTFIHQEAMRLHRNSHDRSHVNMWLGGTDEMIEGEWLWYHTDRKMNFTHWSPGQPDSYHNHNEDCLLLAGAHGFGWYDFPCSSKGLPICEIESPKPSQQNIGIIG